MNLDILFSGCPRWNIVKQNTISTLCIHGKEKGNVLSQVCLFVLRFYGPVNPMGLCQARSFYLTTRLLGRLSPLSG